ncbi:hypothetical protein LUCX_173 [Xanthomonas phage vB_XciM_LucasX]|nr:hypothetical protein LUCX_173 [Xanthomonas phage vB_XciM_LucasX]
MSNRPATQHQQIVIFCQLVEQLSDLKAKYHHQSLQPFPFIEQGTQESTLEPGFYDYYVNGHEDFGRGRILVLHRPSGFAAPTENEEPQYLQVLISGPFAGGRALPETLVSSSTNLVNSRLSLGTHPQTWSSLGDLKPWIESLETMLLDLQVRLGQLRKEQAASNSLSMLLREVADKLDARTEITREEAELVTGFVTSFLSQSGEERRRACMQLAKTALQRADQ